MESSEIRNAKQIAANTVTASRTVTVSNTVAVSNAIDMFDRLRMLRNHLNRCERRAAIAMQNQNLRYEQRMEAKGRVVAYRTAIRNLLKAM